MQPNLKKILYIHPVSGSGGALQALLYLVKELDKFKYYPIILCPGFGKSYEVFKNNGIDVEIEKGIKMFCHATAGWHSIKMMHRIIIDSFNLFYSALSIYKIIKKENPDLVHLSSSVLLGAALGARLARVPIVWHVREYIHSGYFGVRKSIITTLINKLSDVIIVISKTDANRFKPSTKIHVIYDSVDFEKFNRHIDGSKFKKEFNIKEKDKTIGMFGGVSRIKGTLEFVKAAEIILRNNKHFKFFIFGNPISINQNPIKTFIKKIIFSRDNYSDKVFSLINQNNNYIQFVGDRRDIPQIMAGLDLIVFPSTASHSALPVIEAGAMAKPVVASNFGETAEEVVHQKTGILVEPGNPVALSKAIIEILNDSELASKMGEAGYLRAKQLFDINKNIKMVEKFYERILNKQKNENNSN